MSNSQGSHRADGRGRRRTPVAPPAPVAAPRTAASVHDQLTVVGVMRPPAAVAHLPTVIDTALAEPSWVPRRTAAVPAAAGGRAEARRAAAGQRKRARPGQLRRLVPQALVVAFLAGGTSAFLAHDKAVTLSVDGSPRTLHTFADDVAELLDEEGVTVGAHGVVAPGPGAALDDGDEVAVRTSRARAEGR